MRGSIATILLFLAAVSSPLHARPVNRCRVVSGEKLLASSGGARALCAEIERAIAAAVPTAKYTAEVKALSSTRLAATLIVDGRMLPVQNFAVMDDTLKPASMKRFADSIAREVVAATKPH
jgi:hypothetical protein